MQSCSQRSECEWHQYLGNERDRKPREQASRRERNASGRISLSMRRRMLALQLWCCRFRNNINARSESVRAPQRIREYECSYARIYL